MSKIVGIGANVCDTLITIPYFPAEDTKLEATFLTRSGGGPCATGLAAAAKLGADCAFIGTLTNDSAGKFLKADLKQCRISTRYVTQISGCTSFSSCILLNTSSKTRTCMFHKGTIPDQHLTNKQKKAVMQAELLMIDGNNMTAAYEAVQLAKENGTKVLYDAGGLYDGVEKLLPFTDILIPSEEFALHFTSSATADDAAKKLFVSFAPEIVVITQGEKGGLIYDGTTFNTYPAFCVDAVDTNGAGDVFHGAFAYAVTNKFDYIKACIFSSAVSALKCTKIGARTAVPSYDDVIYFLKERNYNEF